MRSCSRRHYKAITLAMFIYLAQPRPTKAESRFDYKVLHYQEEKGRMRIISPTFLYEYVPSPDLRIKLEVIYNSISGATPTGEPLVRNPTTMTSDYIIPSGASPSSDSDSDSGASPDGEDGEDDDDEDEDEDEEDEKDERLTSRPKRVISKGGASPSVATSSESGSSEVVHDSVPTAYVEDTRLGGSLDVSKRFGRHTLASQLAYSIEDDYESFGVALRDAINLNDGSTILIVGGALSADTIDAFTMEGAENKDTVDYLVGITQLLSPQSYFTFNLSAGNIEGYLSDPYKVVELNGELTPERRPMQKDKETLYIAHSRLWEGVDGSSEISYRLYNDTFGIVAHTVSLAWYQRYISKLIVRPSARIYTQSKADFYGTRFSGDPEHYSSDYRISEMMALHYGLKFIWLKSDRLTLDIALERYEQQGLGEDAAPSDAYPAANVITGGLGLWL